MALTENGLIREYTRPTDFCSYGFTEGGAGMKIEEWKPNRVAYPDVRRCRECAECGPYCDPNAYESCPKRKTDGSCWRRYEEITDAE